jgi:3-dehydroquinate synthetase
MPTTPVRKIDLVTQLTRARNEFAKAPPSDERTLDVRLVVDFGDQTWWLATGDAQYDTVHGDACAAGTIWASMGLEDLDSLATELLSDIDNQAADYEADVSEDRHAMDPVSSSARDMFPSDCPDRE